MGRVQNKYIQMQHVLRETFVFYTALQPLDRTFIVNKKIIKSIVQQKTYT